MVICDIEANGLLDTVTKIHCAVLYNTETDKYLEFTPSNIDTLPETLKLCPSLSFHNGVGYDLPLLEKVAGFVYMKPVFDTLLASRILFPDLDGKAPHSVDSWGQRFEIEKPKHEDWLDYSPEMLHRCKEDVKIQTKLYQHIQGYISDLAIRDSRITNDSFYKVLQFEQEVYKIMEQQANNGWAFDLPLAYKLIDQLNQEIQDVETALMPQMPIKVIRVANKETKAFNKDGSLSIVALRWWDTYSNKLPPHLVPEIEGDFSKVRFEPFNLSSSSQVKEYLLSKGWVPAEYNLKRDEHGKPLKDRHGNPTKTSPKSPNTAEQWDDVAEQIQDENIKLLALYNKANHRKHQIEGFIRNLRPDHRIEAQANTCGTNTARMQHRIIVNVPKADEKIYYGKEMRSLFKAEDGKVLVGVDACALEARIEAHYIYPFDQAGAYELIEGDIHSINAKAFGVSRQMAKGGKYALTYGCSKTKLATTLGKPQSAASELYDAFWEANPGLKRLKELVEEAYDKRGYLLAIDGRPLTIRYKHALINTLFQSAGSIVMKRALVILNTELHENIRTPWKFVGNFHDEIQIECLMEDAHMIGDIACDSIRKAGEFYKLNVGMDGEFKVGHTWADTH